MKSLAEIYMACAEAAHEINRIYCMAKGDMSQPIWRDAPEWQKSSAVAGVVGIIEHNNTPADSHASWMEMKRIDGWVYGPVKDPETKQHPCMVPYEDLPPHQRLKDDIFSDVVRMVFNYLKMPESNEHT